MTETKKLKITQVKTAADNPRSITKDKFEKLINSILVFPKMMEIRPVVVDRRNEAIGGNMRLRALREIAKMDAEQVCRRLLECEDYTKMPKDGQQALLAWWNEWFESPFVYVMDASHFTEEQRRQFMIKDNASFGTWDYDRLANEWDNKQLGDWGMDVWQTPAVDFPAQPDLGATGDGGVPPTAPQDPLAGIQDALPEELRGVDCTPDALPKSDIEQETPCDYITISYQADEKKALADYIGLPEEVLFSKVCWRIADLQKALEEGKGGLQE